MGARVAIEKRSNEQNPRWMAACTELAVDGEMVDCYQTDVISKLRRFDGLIWHFSHSRATDLLMARHVIAAAERMGLAVFPNTDTCWHFDDKIAQKYVLEALGAPLVPSYVFYDMREALAWLETAPYPLVSKLRRGAGSFNVRLVNSYDEARRQCDEMFGEGSSPAPAPFADSRRRIGQMLVNPRVFWRRLTGLRSYLRENRAQRRELPTERGYVFFQQFIPGNTFDVRVTVVGGRAWGFTRGVRPGDFRASGSGRISYDRGRIPEACVRIGFAVATALRSQSTAFDFVLGPSGEPMIVEISYGYEARAVFNAPGHWTPDLVWHEGHMWPQTAIMTDLVKAIEARGLRS
ncbi:MAG: RimK family alpha-L-glutamate ligase [Phycisphaerae bacterium]